MTLTRRKPAPYPRIRLAHFNKLVNLVMNRQFQARGLDITREQEVILRELGQQDGCNQAELAQRTGQDRNNLSRTLDILFTKGLVAREACADDKRHSIIRLTAPGRRMQVQALDAVNAYRDVLFAGFTPNEIDSYAAMVARLIANLESHAQNAEEPHTRRRSRTSR